MMKSECACCSANFEARRGDEDTPQARFCPACASGRPTCRVCDGLALTRALAHRNPNQKDFFRA